MYKRFLLITLALLLSHALFSQNQSGGNPPKGKDEWKIEDIFGDKSYRIGLGPKVGANLAIATQPTTYNFNFNNGLGYLLGLSANAHFGRRYPQSAGGTGLFGIETEIIYCLRKLGMEEKEQPLTMHTIEIPVLVQYYPTPSIAVEVGPTFTKTLKRTPNQLQLEEITLNSDRLLENDVMLTVGIAYKTPINLMIDFRYNHGLSNMAGNLDSKVSSLALSFVYLFNIGSN